MIMRLLVTLCTAILLFSFTITVCAQQPRPILPKSLVRELVNSWGGYRPLDHNDIQKSTLVEYYKGVLPTVPGIACADYDGNGTTDYALLLINENHKAIALVVAFAFSFRWRLVALRQYGLCPVGLEGKCYPYDELYLEVIPPGSYTSMIDGELYALTEELQREGYVASITSKTPGLYWGKLETEGTAFFFRNGKWALLEW